MTPFMEKLGRVAEWINGWIIRHTPRIVITDTAWVMLAVALIGLGGITLASIVSGNYAGVITDFLRSAAMSALWAGLFLAGGLFHLSGLHASSRGAERLGMKLLGLGCLAYSPALFSRGTGASIALGFVFLFFAIGYGTRLMVSNEAKFSRARAARG